jgi:hypothetical protein
MISIRRHRDSRLFFRALLVAVILMAGGWLLLLLGQLGRPSIATHWVEQAYSYKLARASAVEQPRLLIVAGSGAMFGLDSARIAQALGRPVINLGVNAGVQSLFILAYARQALRPGDWVLLPLEYPLYHDRQRVNYSTLDYWLSHPGGRALGITTWQALSIYWQTPVARVWSGYRGLPAQGGGRGLYGPHNLDELGDQLNSRASQQEAWMREAVERSASERYGMQASSFNANWSSWRELAWWVEAHGGCALFVPPALLDRPEYHNDPEMAYYKKIPEMARANGLRYVGSPFDFMYPLDFFFDTNYHLTAEARTVHTARLLELIRPEFARCR